MEGVSIGVSKMKLFTFEGIIAKLEDRINIYSLYSQNRIFLEFTI
jgi:hypothetical protein